MENKTATEKSETAQLQTLAVDSAEKVLDVISGDDEKALDMNLIDSIINKDKQPETFGG